MRVSVCVGDYAETPYCIPGLEMSVCSMEELCYCMKENAFLLDLSILDDELLKWIERECGLRELAGALYPLVHRQGSLSAFVMTILEYVGLYDEGTVGEIGQVLKQGAGLTGIEKRKSQIDYLVKKKKYVQAIRGYDGLLQQWQETAEEALPAVSSLAAIWHNKGVAYAGLMLFDKAAECFWKAYELDSRGEYCEDYLAAKRLLLSEEDYLAFVAERGELYAHTLELEKRIERCVAEWEQQPEYLRLFHRRELRTGGELQKYEEDSQRLTQTLKESYRNSINDR